MALKGEKTPEATKAKMRAAHAARWAQNRTVYLQACNWIHIGMKRSKATKRRMAAAQLGKRRSPETVEKMRAAAKIRWAQRP